MQPSNSKRFTRLKNVEYLVWALELFCRHSIRLNHDINKLIEIIYVGITKQIMPKPSGDMAE